jgi:pyruvate kinase
LATAGQDVAGIACYTRTGRTAEILSSLRPRVPVFAFSPNPAVVRRLALVHGVVPRIGPPADDLDARVALKAWMLREHRHVAPGTAVVLVASTDEPGSGPNLLEVHRVPAEAGVDE